MALKNKTNDELFALYDAELILKVHNTRNLENDRRLLAKFHSYLNSSQPSPELAKGFLNQFSVKKRGTLARYAATIKSFMKWYGEPMDNFKVKVPKTLPPYTEDSDIEKLFTAAENKKSHKGCIVRDSLLLTIALKTGMRRSELANLEPKDVHADFLVVRGGKGGKDRMIPLSPATAERLKNFIEGLEPYEKVFKLKATTISNKITRLSQKAGLNGFHAHLLRHKFATNLLEKGVNIKVVQELLGHADLGSTQAYLSLVDQGLYDAISQLDKEDGEDDGLWGIDPTTGLKWPKTY